VTFPFHDQNWTSVIDFLKPHLRAGDRILAPDDFVSAYKRIYRYANTSLRPDQSYDWALVHKGQLELIAPGFLRRLPLEMTPVLANAVFVVWTGRRDIAPLDRASPHFRAYFEQLQELARTGGGTGKPAPVEPVLPDPGMLVQFATMSDTEFREAMNRFWQHGGYRYETLRDKAYYAELDDYLADYIGTGAGERILDLACGTGRLRDAVTEAEFVAGVDIAESALAIARATHRDLPRFSFQVMDAQRLGFADASFDTVLFVDAIEHVMDFGRVLPEIARVTRPGGKFFMTVSNSEGVNQIMSRKLGLGDFVTNYQHVREFSYPEIEAMLAQHGFSLLRSGGIFQFPYFGVPGIDAVVRHLTDHDPEVVEMFRVLGRRCGPEYAFAFAVLAEKGSLSAFGKDRNA